MKFGELLEDSYGSLKKEVEFSDSLSLQRRNPKEPTNNK